jgi:hypothetical protein
MGENGDQPEVKNPADIDDLEKNWSYVTQIDMSDRWDGDLNWGGSHKFFSFKIDTKSLIENGKLREDCRDIRLSHEDDLVPSRILANSCGTNQTWIFFSNYRDKNGDFAFNRDERVEELDLFFGNENAGLKRLRVSGSNRNLATLVHPEGFIEMYYGSHGGVSVSSAISSTNDRDKPEVTWSASFSGDHGSVGINSIKISDNDDNSVTRTNGVSSPYTLDSSNAPDWLEQGDEVGGKFYSNSNHDGDTASTSTDTVTWGYPVSFSNPRPAKSNTGNPVGTTSPDLKIDISEPNGNDVDVTFYDDSDNSIGSYTVNGGSGTASVEWSGLNEANTYNWYAEGCTGGCKTTSTYEFDVNGIPSIDSINFYNSSTDHEFTAEAVVTDSNGDNDLDSCSIEVTDQSGDSNSYNPGFENVDGDNQAICSTDIRYDDLNEWSHVAELDVEFTVSDSKNQDTRSEQNTFPNHDPDVTSMTFENYDDEHAFNVTAIVSDTDSNNPHELDSTCQFEFADNDGNTVTKSVPMNYNYGNSNEAKCFYDNINASMPYPSDIDSGFEPNENINVSLEIRDSHSGTDMYWEEKSIPNSPPEVDVIGPKNGEGVLTNDAQLEIRVDDPEDDNIELVEYRDLDGNIIESFPNPPQQTQYTAEWENLDTGDYEWEVEVSDKWDSTIRGYFAFERTISNIYRVRHTIDHQYSSLIVDEGGQASMFFESDVATDNRTVTTYVEGDGIDVEYADGSTQKSYEVDTGEPDRFQLRISALDTGKNELRIITEDDSVSTNTTTTFPVYVRESVEEGQSVPGIGLIQLVALALAGLMFYYTSV